MALTLKDRVLETAAAPGTGAVTLLGAVTGYQTFSAAIGNGNTCYYTIADQSGANWEVGIGTYSSSGNTLARTTVLSSSNAGSTVNFASGTQNVFVTYPSEKAVYLDASGNVQPSLGTATFSSITDSGLTSGRVTYAGTSGLLQDSANLTFNGTTLTANTLNLTNALGVAYGGTGLTTLTSGYIPYGNGTGAFSSSANLYFSGSNLGIGTSSPASQLQVSSSGNTPIDITSTGTGAVWTRYNTSTYYFDIGINNSAGTTFSTDAYANVLWGANNYPIVFATNNTERMRLTSAGYLGIGTSSPSYTLDVQSGSYAQIRLKTSSSYDAILGQDGSSNFNISNGGSVQMTLTASGNLGLGVTPSAWSGKAFETPAGGILGYSTSSMNMTQNAYFNGTNWIYKNTAAATYYGQGASGAGQHAWYTAPSGTAGNAITFTQAMTLTNSGTLFVGQTSAVVNENGMGVSSSQTSGGSGVLNVTNTASSSADNSPPVVICKAMTTTSSSARFVQFYANTTATPMGGIVGNGASNVQFASISDAREKTNIAPINGSLNKILALKPSSFDWIKDGSHVNAGFIAQDVQTVFPEFVVENMANEGEEQRYGLTGGMNGGIIAHLVSAIQELKAEFDAYKATHP